MSVTRLCFQLDAGGNTIDLARALSLHLRTHKIHQKQTFTVLGGMVVDNPETNKSIEISTAPNTWYVKSAINRVFRAWKDYRHKALAASGLEASKYADFRLLLNTTGNIKDPITTARNSLAVEEWQYAQLENEAGVQKTFRIVGNHGSSTYSALKGWLETRPIPAPYSEPVQADLDGDGNADYLSDYLVTLEATNDNITDQVQDAVEENDERPYVLTQAYGDDIDLQDNLQTQSFHYVSANNPHAMIPGFKAVCGLIQVNCQSGVTAPLLYLDVLNTPEAF